MIRHKPEAPQSLLIAGHLVIIAFIIAFLYIAQNILIPLAFGALFALLLYPLCRLLEDNGFPRVLAVSVSLIAVILFITGLIVLLSTQIYSFAGELPAIATRIDEMVEDIEWFFFKNFNIQVESSHNFVRNSLEKFMDSGVVLLSGTITTFLNIIEFLGLVPVYIFLFLLYRNAFQDFILFVSPIEKHRSIKRIMFQIQKVVQNYVIGMFTVMGIVAILNTLALFIIGVDYAIFFGLLAALLMLIPYIGIFIGSMLPAAYALLTMDSAFYSFLVITCFSLIQFMEGNFITPRITGGRVQINALAAIVALVVGGYLWGMAGMIVFMPFVAILKVMFDNIDGMKAYGMLLGTEIYEGQHFGINLKPLIPKKLLNIAPSRRKKNIQDNDKHENDLEEEIK